MDDIMSRRMVYQIPGMDEVQVRAGIAYKTVEDGDLKLDVYLPSDLRPNERRPAVLFVHGEPWTTEAVRFDTLATGQYISWGRLVAASGWIGVPFEHRNSRACTALPEVAADLDNLIAFVRTQIPEADPDRLILWVCSGGGAYGLRAAIRHAAYIRCAVVYYAFLEPLYYREIIAPEVSDETLREYSPITTLGQPDVTIPPLLLARAGQDHSELNETTDRFAAEALRQNVSLDMLNYADGQHGFDTLTTPSGHATSSSRRSPSCACMRILSSLEFTKEFSMSESSSESSSAGAQERSLDQIVVAPLAGRTIGSAGTQFIIAEWSDPGLPPGPPRPIAPLHVHHEDDEAWYVLEGALAFQLGDHFVEVGAGGAAFAPRGLAHTYWNPRQERARYLLIMTPAIRALIADLHATDDRSPEAMRAIYQRHHSELLASG